MGALLMPNSVPRTVVDAFYQAYISRDPEQIGAMLDEDVEWYVAGPVEVMQVCGYWRGKAAVVDRFARIVPQVIKFKSLDTECLLVDGDSSALFGRIACLHRPTGRLICHRVAHFVRYRNGKVVYFRVINDSLDAAEQFIGHRITLTDDAVSICNDQVPVEPAPALTPI
jgi:ketosteroid isomerase-like protein